MIQLHTTRITHHSTEQLKMTAHGSGIDTTDTFLNRLMGIGFAPKTQRTGKGKEKNKSHYHTSSQLQQTQHAVEEDFDFFGVLTQYIGSTGTTRPATDVNESDRHITKSKKIYLEKVTTIDRADVHLEALLSRVKTPNRLQINILCD